MRASRVLLIACGAIAAAGVAVAQQITLPTAPPTSQNASGGAPAGLVQSTANDGGFSTAAPRPVYAVIGHHLVSGDIAPRSTLLTLVDAGQPQFLCHVSHRGTDVGLACSDGSSAALAMSSGACGVTRAGEPASLCIGLPARSAAKRLVAPPGYALVRDDGGLRLTPLGG